MSDRRWERLLEFRDALTCYSAALAAWSTMATDDWPRHINTGLWLSLTEPADGLFGFGYFPPGRRTELGLVRTGAEDLSDALDGVAQEIARSGRVIIAGDGFNLPWHVAADRVHAPHWFVLSEGEHGLEVTDPFACRNELGVQTASRQGVSPELLPSVLRALPGGDTIFELREVLSLGDEAAEACDRRFQWFVAGEVDGLQEPLGAQGPDAIMLLAEHFRRRGGDPAAYAQADDIWSIARHRSFMAAYVGEVADREGDAQLADWAREHATPLAKKWGHIAPLLMQAMLTLRAGREPSSSVPDTLERLADIERRAALALVNNSVNIRLHAMDGRQGDLA